MTRRAALPGAAELFRSTSPPRANRDPQANRDSDWVGTSKAPRGQDAEPADGNRLGTGRQKHDSKTQQSIRKLPL